jgi:hypothetical protein
MGIFALLLGVSACREHERPGAVFQSMPRLPKSSVLGTLNARTGAAFSAGYEGPKSIGFGTNWNGKPRLGQTPRQALIWLGAL